MQPRLKRPRLLFFMRANREQEQAGSAHREMGFLVACVRRRYAPASPMPASDGLDWQKLIELALRHRVIPLFHGQIAGLVPDEVGARIKDLHLSNAARNITRAEEVRRLDGRFRDAGVPLLFLRGPVLAASVYGDLSLRQFSDLDLLVRPRDVQAATRILLSEGYQPQFQLDDLQERTLTRFRTERCFIRAGDRSVVDLHWQLLPRFFSFEEDDLLWSRSVDSANVRTLGREDLFLFLCVHGAKHGWDQLALVCDLAEMIRAGRGMDWAGALARAEARGKTRMVALGLELVRQVLGVTSSVAVRVDQKTSRLVDECRARLEEGVGAQKPGSSAKWSLAWRMLEGAGDRLAYAADLTMIPTGVDCERVRLPGWLFPAYYLVRQSRMLGRLFRRRTDRRES